MKKLALLLLLVAFAVTAFFAFSGCRKDVFVLTAETLTGDYIGTMYYQVGQTVPDSEFINWRFSSNAYTYSMDTTRQTNGHRVFCDAYGTYELTDAVILAQDPNWKPTSVCDETRNPQERYVIVSRTETTLKLSQSQSGGVNITVMLTRK